MNESAWETRQLGECVMLLSGGTPSKRNPDYWGGRLPWVSCKDMKVDRLHDAIDHLTPLGAENGTKVVPAGTILIVVRGMILAKEFPVAVAMRDVAFNQDLKAVLCRPGLNSMFTYYWLRANSHLIKGIADEAAHGTKRLQTDRLLSLEVRVPPLPIQRKIAAILSAYDDLIENNIRRIQILEDMARAIYREWFVEYRFPRHEGVEMVESEVGFVPNGWEIVELCQVARIHRGRSYRSSNLVEEGGMPFFNLKSVDRDGGYRADGLKWYDGPFKSTQQAEPGDIIIAVTDMTQERRIVARAARVPSRAQGVGVLSMDLVKVEAVNAADTDYLYHMLRFSPFPDHVKQYANGANVLHLRPDRIAEYRFAIAPKHLRGDFVAIASAFHAQQDLLEAKNQVLRSARDLLLPRLVSGELDVSDLDIDVGEAA